MTNIGCSFFQSGVAKIFIGRKRKEYHVHTDLLCDRSKWFKTYFANPHEDRHNVYRPDIDASDFEAFLQWLYTSCLHLPYAPPNQSVRPLLYLYFLATKFECEMLCNVIMDGVRYYYRDAESLPLHDVLFVYSKCRYPNPLRTFMVTGWTYDVLQDEENRIDVVYGDEVGSVLEKGGDLAKDLYREMMDRAVRHRDEEGGDNPYLKSYPLTFHIHDDTPQCDECKDKERFQ